MSKTRRYCSNSSSAVQFLRSAGGSVKEILYSIHDIYTPLYILFLADHGNMLEYGILPGNIAFYPLRSTADNSLRAYIAQGEVLPAASRFFGNKKRPQQTQNLPKTFFAF